MFEYHQNTLCVQASWLIEGVFSKDTYDKLIQRDKIRRLVRGGRGRAALIEYDTLPEQFKNKIVELVGDPRKKAKAFSFNDYLINDLEAVKFFGNYTLANGQALPQKNIAEYVANAVVLNAIGRVIGSSSAKARTLGGKTKKIWADIAAAVADLPQHTYPHSLPENERRLKDKHKNYIENGYESLIHRGFCNTNSEKINDDAKLWVLSRWADQVNRCASTRQLFQEYNQKAKLEGWKELKDDDTIYNYLHQEDVKYLWWGHRYGELDAKEKFGYQHSTKLPTMRDSLWYSDGTKLNYFYQYTDKEGKQKVGTVKVYEVMDAFSEVLLGFHVSKEEDYVAQFAAYKMAVQTAGFRPYQIGFDNQGGHKKLDSTSFLSKISRLSIATKPYNGKSKTIENAFGRFQQQFLKQDWFFTGQNVTATSKESKANREFIDANIKNLPTLEEIIAVYEKRRAEWNNAKHPKSDKSRIEMYLSSHNPQAREIDMLEMVDLFWVTRPVPIMLTAFGLCFTEKKVEYKYMVYDNDKLPDFKWLRENIDRKFVVKYDPEDMGLIHVFEQTPSGLRFATAMTTKIEVHRGKQEQEEWEASWIAQVQARENESRIETRDRMEQILHDHGATAEQQGLNTPALKGIERRRKAGKNYGTILKKEADLVLVPGAPDEDDDFDLASLM